MHDRFASALSRTSIRIVLALILAVTTVTAGTWAADFVGGLAPTGTPAGTPAASATTDATPSPSADEPTFNLNGAGAKNIVNIRNTTDNRLIVHGRVQFNKIPAPRVAPVNAAIAASSCTGCQTYAVALQINLYQRNASVVAPQNAAVAGNGGCFGCVTMARAVQFTIPVDDIQSVPGNVKQLARELDKELKTVEGVYDTSEMTAFQANGRITAIIAEFKELGAYLIDESRIETATDSPSAAPDATPLPTEEPATPAPTPAPDATPCPSATADASPTPSSGEPSECPAAATADANVASSNPSPEPVSASP